MVVSNVLVWAYRRSGTQKAGRYPISGVFYFQLSVLLSVSGGEEKIAIAAMGASFIVFADWRMGETLASMCIVFAVRVWND